MPICMCSTTSTTRALPLAAAAAIGLAGSSAILTTPAFDAVTYLSTPYGGSAKAINNQNMIVGTTGSNSSAGEYAHAYLYDYNADSLQDLGTLNDGRV